MRGHGYGASEVGLLSNEEAGKGNAQTRQVLPLLEATELDVVEHGAGDAMSGACDVLVCDGFVSNAVLKAAEGAADRRVGVARPVARAWRLNASTDLSRAAPASVQHIVGQIRRRGSPGVDGVLVVEHGRATSPQLPQRSPSQTVV